MRGRRTLHTRLPSTPSASTRFHNRHPHDHRGGLDLLRLWRACRGQVQLEPELLAKLFPLAENDPAWLACNRSQPSLTWIGHDTFLLQWAGLNILTDPHFSERASPFRFAGPRRFVPPGLAFDSLPSIDLVLISHNHYDHLDDASVRRLAREHRHAHFFAPNGLHEWLRQRGSTRTIALDWWQSVDLGRCKVTAVPAQHFSGRGLFDRNRTLWCGFVLEANGERIYFAGDTGYSPDFADIGARFAPIDLALLPIGAYEPRWFMAPMHVDPEEAVRIHQDVGARRSVAMHWGTFRLTTEPIDEPPRRLAQALRRARLGEDDFTVLQHGETLRLYSAAGGEQRLSAG